MVVDPSLPSAFGSNEYIFERAIWVQADGIPFDLSERPYFKWLHHEGFGIGKMLPQAIQVPGQHGSSWKGVLFDTKQIGIDLLLISRSLAELEDRRRQLIRAINPARGGGSLRITQSNRRTYALDCVLSEELGMNSQDNLGLHYHRAVLRFQTTGLPFWRDDVVGYAAHNSPEIPPPDPFFPFSFPFRLTQSGLFTTLPADVEGDVPSPATIIIKGPAGDPVVRNTTTNSTISIPGLILGPNDYVRIKTNPFERAVEIRRNSTDEDAWVKDWSKVRVAQFFMMNPGLNNIEIDIGLADFRTAAQLTWPNYYIGI